MPKRRTRSGTRRTSSSADVSRCDVPPRQDLRLRRRRARRTVLRRVRVRRPRGVQGGRAHRPSSRRPASMQWRWAVDSRCFVSPMSEPDAPRPVAPDELGFERIVYTKEAAAGDDPAQPARGAECVRLPDAARDRPCVRGRLVGRRDSGRRRHRHRPRVLRRRRPEGLGRRSRRQARASTGSGSGRSRTCTTGCARSASRRVARVQGIAVGGGNELQMACDLTVMVDSAFIRTSGPSTVRYRPAARRSGCRSWSATAVRARSSCSASELPAHARRPSGGSSTGRCRRPSSTRRSTRWCEASRRSCRRRCATRSSS